MDRPVDGIILSWIEYWRVFCRRGLQDTDEMIKFMERKRNLPFLLGQRKTISSWLFEQYKYTNILKT